MAKKKEIERFDADLLIKSVKFAQYRDVVYAVLEKDKRYTVEEVEALVKKFLGREVL